MAPVDPRSLPADSQARELIRLYELAQRDIALRVREHIASGHAASVRNRRLQLAAIVALLDQLGRETDPRVRTLVQQALADGGMLADKDVKRLGASVTPNGAAAFHAVNTEALQTAELALIGRLQDARRTVGRRVDDVFRRETLRETVRALYGAEGSPDRAARRLARQLAEQGQSAFTDAAGRRWKLADYADMAIRTTTREAVVNGQVNRLMAHGVTLARVSSHASSCSVCQPFENRLIDLTGTITEYEGQPVSSGPLPPFHPRCRHTIGGVSVMVEQARRELQYS